MGRKSAEHHVGIGGDANWGLGLVGEGQRETEASPEVSGNRGASDGTQSLEETRLRWGHPAQGRWGTCSREGVERGGEARPEFAGGAGTQSATGDEPGGGCHQLNQLADAPPVLARSGMMGGLGVQGECQGRDGAVITLPPDPPMLGGCPRGASGAELGSAPGGFIAGRGGRTVSRWCE